MNLGEAGDEVVIGDDCLFASVKFRTSDSHPLFDATTGERFNQSAPIHIGDRVWMAEDVLVLKGAKIGSGTAVGARALVIGELPENCVAVGMPARAVRQNIRWAEKF
jgi:acetyltransferase-like isoleucine patch superfamily enzyme